MGWQGYSSWTGTPTMARCYNLSLLSLGVQGTQQEFYEDDGVLYVSIHRCN